jgi:hypothetical protein
MTTHSCTFLVLALVRVHAFFKRFLAPHVSASLYVVELIGDTHEFSPVLNYNFNCSLKTPTMPREKTIRVRLSDAEYETLKNHAKDTDTMISEVIRDYIKGLKKKPS